MSQAFNTPAPEQVVYQPGIAAVPGGPNPLDQVPGHTLPYDRVRAIGADLDMTMPVGETVPYDRVGGHVGSVAVAEQARDDYEVGDVVVVPRSRPGVFQRVPVEDVGPDLVTVTLGPNGLIKRAPREALDYYKAGEAAGMLPIVDDQDAFKPEAGQSLMDWQSRVAPLVARQVAQRDPSLSAGLVELTEQDTDGILPFQVGQQVAVLRTSGALEDGWTITAMIQRPDGGMYAKTIDRAGNKKNVTITNLVHWQNKQQRADDMQVKAT